MDRPLFGGYMYSFLNLRVSSPFVSLTFTMEFVQLVTWTVVIAFLFCQAESSESLIRINHPRGHTDAMYWSDGHAYIQRGQTHRIECPVTEERDHVALVYWYRESTLLLSFSRPEFGVNFTAHDHYGMTASYALIVGNARRQDQGTYTCCMVSSRTRLQRNGRLSVDVLDEVFPIREEDHVISNQSSLMVADGKAHVIRCPLTSADPLPSNASLYWSVDTGSDNYTSIIGARYTDGITMVTARYQGDYSITRDGALELDFQHASEGRFWWHVFPKDSPVSCGYIDVITTEGVESEQTTRDGEIHLDESRQPPTAPPSTPLVFRPIPFSAGACCGLLVVVAGVALRQMKRKRADSADEEHKQECQGAWTADTVQTGVSLRGGQGSKKQASVLGPSIVTDTDTYMMVEVKGMSHSKCFRV